ncbi:MAG TPA: hypothetical protein VFO94_12565, partial [Gammaproteobacteria bacterium]|nr:hypothetical protein [Gammaproteobacteria bacterium]
MIELRPAERRSVGLFFLYAFLVLVCYYFVKPLREPLLLVNGSAELKSYASAVTGVALMALVPVYGAVFRRASKTQLVRRVTLFFAANLLCFYALGRAGVDVGFAYYVWVGVFGVTILAQFWAHAAHSFDVQSGQRLFPFVMAGATLGALAGPGLFGALFPVLGRWNMLLVAASILVATLPLVARTRDAVPAAQRNPAANGAPEHRHPLGGFHLVLRDRYLLLLALLVVVLNCVNTTGEYIVTDLVVRHADALAAADPARDKGGIIAAFYGDYFLAVNALTVLLQCLVVGRVFRRIGVAGALLVVPMVAALGYGLIAFVPVFSLILAVKVLENGVDYSLMNTARQAVFLPLPAAQQYEGKTAIDTFFWRLGDVVQAGLIYAGVTWLGLDVRGFALLNALLAVLWIALAARLARCGSGRLERGPQASRRGLRR